MLRKVVKLLRNLCIVILRSITVLHHKYHQVLQFVRQVYDVVCLVVAFNCYQFPAALLCFGSTIHV